MLLKSDCPQCNSSLRIAEWTTGQTIGCPACGAMFFPAAEEVEASKRGVSVGIAREKQSTGRLRPRAPRTKGVKLTFSISVLIASSILVVGMAVAMVWFSRRVPDPDIMALVPSDAVMVGGMNIEEGWRDERAAKVQTAIALRDSYRVPVRLLAPLGFEQKDVMRVIIARGAKSGSTTIVKLVRGRRFDRDKIAAAAVGGESMSIGDRSYIRARKGGLCYYLAAPRVVVVGEEAGILDILGRPPGEIDLNPDLKRLVNRSGGSQVWQAKLGGGGGKPADTVQDVMQGWKEQRGNPFTDIPLVGSWMDITGVIKRAPIRTTGETYWMTVSGEYLELSTATLYDSRFEAFEAGEMSRGYLFSLKETNENGGKLPYNGDLLKAIKIGLDTAQYKVLGPILQSSIKLEMLLVQSELAQRLAKQPGPDDSGIPGMPGVNPPPPPRKAPLPPGGVPAVMISRGFVRVISLGSRL